MKGMSGESEAELVLKVAEARHGFVRVVLGATIAGISRAGLRVLDSVSVNYLTQCWARRKALLYPREGPNGVLAGALLAKPISTA